MWKRRELNPDHLCRAGAAAVRLLGPSGVGKDSALM